MTTATETTTQVYQVFIKATPDEIWAKLIDPKETTKYFYGSRVAITSERRTSTSPDGSDNWGDTAVLEWDPPRRLVHGWQALYDDELGREPISRVTWEIEPQDGGISKVTLVHDQLEESPKTAAAVAGGWMFVLSGLKTLLETGEPLAG